MKLEPRLDPDEIEYFKEQMSSLPSGTKMVEWGSGGSTMMFLPYFTEGAFISIEHNKEWYDKVNKAIDVSDIPPSALKEFSYLWRPPSYQGQPVDLRFYGYGVPFEENPCFAESYIDPERSNATIFDADIFFVDGICRGAVLATIYSRCTNPDAIVYVHDYYGPEKREQWYNWASGLYRKVEKVGSTLARLYL